MTSSSDVPPFIGYVETTIQALRLIHAARQGVIPRITRRLNDSERRSMIKTGAVFVFSVEESGIKRWTDGLLWSPSRIVGNFLVYREINERTSSRGGHKKPYPLEPSTRGISGHRNSPDHSLVAYRGPGHLSQTGTNDPGGFKADGLVKKTITVTIEGSDLHLISYYTLDDVRSGRLKRPTSRPDIMSLSMSPHMFRLTNFRVPPKVEIGPDGSPRLVCEGEDHECKSEETTYHVSEASHWPSNSDGGHRSPSGGTAGSASPTYSEPYEIPSPAIYSSEGTAVVPNSLRIVPVGRQEFTDTWPSTPSPTNSDSCVLRRRDLGHTMQHHPSSWSAGHAHASRWRADAYSETTASGLHHLDRSRVRPNTALEQQPSMNTHRRDNSTTHQFARDSLSHRSAWTPRELTNVDRYARPQPSLPFQSHQGYHRMTQSFGSSWSSGGNNQPVEAVLQPIQTHSLPSYDAPYLASSPEGFSTAEEYADT